MANRIPRIFLAAGLGAVLTPTAAVTLSGQVDADGQPLAQVVVTAEPNGTHSTVKPKTKPKPLALDQKGREFVPHVLAVQTGTAVFFPNSDDIKHHVYSFSPAKRFEIKLYSGTPAKPILFDRPGVVVLGCNIHDWMLGFVFVTDSDYVTQTDSEGHWTLDLPPGEYRLSLWHPDAVDAAVGMANLPVPATSPIHYSLTLKAHRPSGKPPYSLQMQEYDGF